MIDIAKWDAAPRDGSTTVVGTCSCGGEITKRYLQSVVVLGRSINTFDVTCTKGGDACLQPEKEKEA